MADEFIFMQNERLDNEEYRSLIERGYNFYTNARLGGWISDYDQGTDVILERLHREGKDAEINSYAFDIKNRRIEGLVSIWWKRKEIS